MTSSLSLVKSESRSLKFMKSDQLFTVAGRSAIVTGGASGIGLSFAEVLAANGARVTILDMNAQAAQHQESRLRGEGYDVHSGVLDVTDRPALDRAFDQAAQRYGGLDIVFANAGIEPGPGFMSLQNRSQRIPEHALEN